MNSLVLYVHVSDDGGLFVIDESAEFSGWVTLSELMSRISRIAPEGTVLLSRENGSEQASRVLEMICDGRISVVEANEAHQATARPSGSTAMMAYAYLGSVGLLADLIERGCDPNVFDSDGYSAIMYAANGGNLESVAMLLDHGANPNQLDKKGETPLMFAAQHGYKDIVKLLLSRGANPSPCSVTGLTASEIASRNGHESLAKLLLSAELQRQP